MQTVYLGWGSGGLKSFRLMVFCAVLILALQSQLLLAQTGGQQVVEEVVVTGSYIRGTPEDAASPVTVTTREELDMTGNPNIVEMLRAMGPIAGIDGETNQFQSNGLEAISNVNLRGLGAGRTLVLLNGSRVVPSPFFITQDGQQFVNTNAIPSIALSRVELLKDGASATYGSDAVAGVVNFITRSDFRGVEFQGAYKDIQDAEDPDYEAGMIIGFGTDRLDVVLSAAYQSRGELMVREKDWALRPFEANSTPGGWSSIGNPGTFFPVNALAEAATAGTSIFGAARPDPSCNVVGGSTQTFACRFRYTEFDNLAEEEEHYQIFLEATYALSDASRVKAEVLYAVDEATEWDTSPSYPPQALLDGDQIVVPGMPHYDDFLARNDLVGDPAWSNGALFWGRTFGVAGKNGQPRQGPREYDTYRFSLGLEGEFDNGVGYLTKATYGFSQGSRFTPDGRTDHLAYAYRGLGGPNCDRAGFYADPDGSGVVPGSGNLGSGDCYYYNPFTSGFAASASATAPGVPGPGSADVTLQNDPGLQDWLEEDLGSKPETEQIVLDFILNGESNVVAGGGNVAWAAGLQWRKDEYKNKLAANSNNVITPCAFGIQPGETSTVPDTPINGGANIIPSWTYTCTGAGAFNFLAASAPFAEDQDVFATFGEIQVPFSTSFEAQIAVRYEDYGGDVGSTFDPKVALRWDAADTVTLRGSISSSFRAPTLNQLGGEFTSLSFVNPALAFKAVDTRGNPNLAPEEAITTNFGVIWQPSDVASFSLDYWNFDFKDPIVLEPYNDIVSACLDTESPINELACGKVLFQDPSAPSAASIQRVAVDYQNGPDIETNGLDFSASYDVVLNNSILTLGADGTYIMEYKVDAWLWSDSFDAEGRLNADTTVVRPLPELKVNLYTNWASGGHNLRLDVYHTSDYDDDRAGINPGVPAGTEIDEHWTADLHYNFRFNSDNTRLFASIYNVTDEDPPFVRLDLNYDPYTHNPFGRIVKVGVQHRFEGGLFQ